MSGEVPTKQSLRRRYAEQSSEQLGRKPALVYHQTPVDPGAAHIGRVFSEIHDSKPFHNAVVRPKRDIRTVSSVTVYRTSLKIVEIEIQLSEDL